MEKTKSISKGIFVFKNGPSLESLRKTTKQTEKSPEKAEYSSVEKKQLWYETFSLIWKEIEENIEEIQTKSYQKTLDDLLTFIENVDFDDEDFTEYLQTAVLITGVNQTDHLMQFGKLADHITNNINSIVTILQSNSCPSVKSAVEVFVGDVINKLNADDKDSAEKLTKRHYTMNNLEHQFNQTFESPNDRKLVVIVPDFEKFDSDVLKSFIGVLTCYTKKLPIILVLGLATYIKTIHNVLPFDIVCKLNFNVFQTEPATLMLNKVLESSILKAGSPVHLSGKCFKVLMEIFLFYDYSLNGFINGFKLAMFEHFYQNNYAVLAVANKTLRETIIEGYSAEDCEYIRKNFPSFRKLVENEKDPQKRIDLLSNDSYFKQVLSNQVRKISNYWNRFYCFLEFLLVLIDGLPKNNLGKSTREIYPICVSTEVTKVEEFQEIIQFLKFSSKEELVNKMQKLIDLMETYAAKLPQDHHIAKILLNVKNMKHNLEVADMVPRKIEATEPEPEVNTATSSRVAMLENLKKAAKSNQVGMRSQYEDLVNEYLDNFQAYFNKYLAPIQNAPAFIEVSVFSDVHSIKRHLIGTPRGALHTALNNPQSYLQCDCCGITENEQIVSTMPDISIAYKLHLECGKFINLYDWLVAFKTVIQGHSETDDVDDKEIDPEIHARFTRAITELQYLGIIKAAKQKTDHVIRLTW